MFSYLADASIVYAADENGDLISSAATASIEQITQLPPGDYGIEFVKMFLTFIALIILLVGSFWFIKRLIQQRAQKGIGEAAIQILEKRMISPKTMLYLVEVENKKILLAESHLEIKRLESFDKGDDLQETE